MFNSLQRRLIYRPTRMKRVCPVAAGLDPAMVESVSYETDDGLRLQGWHVLPAFGTAPKGTVLFFPGNGYHRGRRGLTCRELSDLGLDVFLFDYRGYAENPGRPTEGLISRDAHSLWNSLIHDRGISPESLIIYGESLGGGVATRLTAELCERLSAPRGLILCATFSSLLDAAIHNYGWLPVRSVLVERYPSLDLIRSVSCPLLSLHGERDRVVPISLGRRLFNAAPEQGRNGIPKQFVTLPSAGHNDFLKVEASAYRAGILEFLKNLGVPATLST